MLGFESITINQTVRSNRIHKEIIAGTSERQSIVRSRVLSTIDGGTNVLKRILDRISIIINVDSRECLDFGIGFKTS